MNGAMVRQCEPRRRDTESSEDVINAGIFFGMGWRCHF